MFYVIIFSLNVTLHCFIGYVQQLRAGSCLSLVYMKRHRKTISWMHLENTAILKIYI